MDDRVMLTVPEAARLLRIGRNLAYQLVASGDIPSRRLGRRLLIPVAELEARFGLVEPSDHATEADAVTLEDRP